MRYESEAELQYASRTGAKTEFHFGDVSERGLVNYDAAHLCNGSPEGECREETTDVGSFPANPWGLFDMHGNVWEWCEAWFCAYGYEDQTDPVQLEHEIENCRVVRGGSWRYTPDFCRAACRDGHDP